MNTIKKFFRFGSMIFILVIASCAKDGDVGITGAQGIAGTDGTNGKDGNANVISVLFEDQTIANGVTVFDMSQLTQEIFDTGFVYAYVTVTGNNYWEPLPLSQAKEIILEIDRIEVGKVTLRATFTQSNLRLRFVLVEGIDASGINFKNYEEVESYYNLGENSVKGI
ncbi:MAG: hypothetical protein V3U92_20375 [Cellulophaga sp.]